MARIKKEDHARILHLVDVEHRTVRDIATEFGCTTANIYSLLAKMRRGADHGGDATAKPAVEGEIPSMDANPAQPVLGLEARLPRSEANVLARPVEVVPARPQAVPLAVVSPTHEPPASPSALPASVPERPPIVGARLSKPGMGLVMRTEDGEETMTPFRSIDDLLSAIKPLLRATARNPDPVWFSLQPVDLSAIDVDAA